MNINKYLLWCLSFVLLFSIKSQAQFSVGGTPKGFSSKIKQEIPIIKMQGFDVEAMLAEDEIVNTKGNGPYRFGKNFDVNLHLNNSGSWINYPNGDRLWQLAITSPQAYSINLQFSYYHLPPDAELYVYNSTHTMVLGAFTYINNQDDGLFATDLVQGEKIIVEYYEPAQVRGMGVFTIGTVTHAYRNIFSDEFTKSFGTSGACQFNVACPLSDGWEEQIRSVVMLVSGGSGFCTGALVNNTANDGKPYILTANHCGSSGFGTWVFRFNWQSPTCTNPSSSPSYQSLTGAVQRASWAGADMSLVEITGGLTNGSIPDSYNAYFSGWSNIDTPADSAFAIHHPDGDIKKFSVAKNPTQTSTMGGATCWKAQWTKGCTEPGSSGSPLYDQNKRIVGQLYGGNSACGASQANMNDNYGKFSASWLGGNTNSTQLKYWLDPANINASTLDGFDPFAVSLTLDANLTTIVFPNSNLSTCSTSITPSVKVKNNGINDITNFIINYTIDGGSPTAYNWSGNLASGQLITVILPTINGLTTGSHTLSTEVTNPNGATDLNPANDQKQVVFNIIDPNPQTQLPIFQGAESGQFPGNNWSIVNSDNATAWIVTNTGGFGTSSKSFKFDNYSVNAAGQSDFIVSPYIDLINQVAPVQATFDLAYARYYSNQASDSLIVSVSDNCEESWTRVYSKGGVNLATIGGNGVYNTGPFTPTSTQWRQETIDLNSCAGKDKIKIRFENKSNYGNNMFIDNINILASGTPVLELNSNNNLISLFPNPSDGKVSIITGTNNQINEVSIINLLGEEILNKKGMSSTSVDLDLKLPVGIFFAKVYLSNKQQVTKKLIIQ